MSGSVSRRQTIESDTTFAIPDKDFTEPLGDLCGKHVFGPSSMRSRLPEQVYKSVLAGIEQGAP